MENKGYLFDTNVWIYWVGLKLSPQLEDEISVLNQSEVYISYISWVELLSWPRSSQAELSALKQFVEAYPLLMPTREIGEVTALLRRNYKLKLADAFIAATALHHNLTLVTFDRKDFDRVSEVSQHPLHL